MNVPAEQPHTAVNSAAGEPVGTSAPSAAPTPAVPQHGAAAQSAADADAQSAPSVSEASDTVQTAATETTQPEMQKTDEPSKSYEPTASDDVQTSPEASDDKSEPEQAADEQPTEEPSDTKPENPVGAITEEIVIDPPISGSFSSSKPRRTVRKVRFHAEKKEYRYLYGILAALLYAFVLLAPLTALYLNESFCYIYESGVLRGLSVCDSADYEDIFASAHIEYDAADEVKCEKLGGTSYLTVTRAFPVSVKADGKEQTVRVVDATVSNALEKLGLTLGENDLLEPAADTKLKADDVITVKRVTYAEREVKGETVPWREVDKPSPLISEGEELYMDEGEQRDGVADRVYRDTYVDGVLTQSEIISEVYDDFPWNLVKLVGDDDAHMSPLDGAQFTDIQIVDNAPTEYERVLENGVCTAYSYNPGVYGASGMYMIQGFVAVDTSVIPYGSLLYITSPTGRFTYGWAVAADIGEAMVAGYVDIDLFFETYRESALFGKHKMNVYIVKQLTQSELEQYIANEGMFRKRIAQ